MVFLRAINVGGNRIRMTELVEITESVAGPGVRSYIATGNLVVPITSLSRDDLAAGLDAAYVARGLKKVVAIIRHPDEIAALRATDPFRSTDPATNRLAVTLLREPVEVDRPLPSGIAAGIEIVHRDPDVICAAIARTVEGGVGSGAPIESKWKVLTTTRWWNVVEEFHTLATSTG